MKKILLSVYVLAGIAFFSACSKSTPSPSNVASVMFVNACPGTTGIIAKANNTTVSGATNIALFKTSGYQEVTAGSSVPFAFTLTDGTPLISGTGSLTINDNYSVFAGGLITGSSFVIANDDLTAPNAGNAKIRFINLCSDGFGVNCYIGANKIDSNLNYQNYSPFYEVTATTANVLLSNPAAPAVDFASLSNQQFIAGKIYTVMLTGSSAATSGSSVLTLTVINNN